MKADALPLLHKSSFHGPVLYLQLDGRSWNDIMSTQQDETIPPECPNGKTFTHCSILGILKYNAP